jgi:hypothetical protein
MHRLSLEQLHNLTGILVDIALLLGAIGAAIKFRIFNILGPRWRSEVVCSHYELADSAVIFIADYTLHNTGQRPLVLSDVTMRLIGTKQEGILLVPDKSSVIAERIMKTSDSGLTSFFEIKAGERNIFALQAVLPRLDDAVFIICSFSLAKGRAPAEYRGLYISSAPKNKMVA